MSPEECADVTLALMAMADGEKPLLPADVVMAHLENCAVCQREVDQLENLATFLSAQKRRELSEDLWPALAEQLAEGQWGSANVAVSTRTRGALLALGLLLVVYKLVEMIPERHLGLLFKLAPLLLVILWFGYVKENPFKINPGLTLEGER